LFVQIQYFLQLYGSAYRPIERWSWQKSVCPQSSVVVASVVDVEGVGDVGEAVGGGAVVVVGTG